MIWIKVYNLGTHPEDYTCITYSTDIYRIYTVYTLVYIKQVLIQVHKNKSDLP